MEKIITVGNIGGGQTQSRMVYMPQGLSPTLCSGMDHGNTIPYIVEVKKMDIEVIGKMDHTLDNTFESANRVYNAEKVAPSIITMGGGNLQPKVLEVQVLGGLGEKKSNNNTQYFQQDRVYDAETVSPALNSQGEYFAPKVVECVAMRGRPTGEKNEQKLEINGTGTVNTLTSVQKDNLILETEEIPKIKVRQATTQGFIEVEVGGGGRFELPDKPKTKRKGARRRSDMPDSDNGEYP